MDRRPTAHAGRGCGRGVTFDATRLNSRMLSRPQRNQSAFTLLELLTVIAIILILVGISVGTYGYANNKAARSRAEAEIRALAAACENFKTDNGEYPRVLPGQDPANQWGPDKIDPRTMIGVASVDPQGNPNSTYVEANTRLYELLSGLSLQGAQLMDTSTPPVALKSYFTFKPNQLKRSSSGQVLFVSDPWGSPYGYSTARFFDSNIASSGTATRGFNPTIDIWSTSGRKALEYNTLSTANALWIKNW